MHDGKRLLHNFDKLWQKYSQRLAACQQSANEEAVHKLRISCRRLLSLIQLLQALTPEPGLRKLRKSLKAQLDNFDELRDTQVMLLEVADSIDSFPDLASYQQYLQHNEQRLLARAPSLIQNLDTSVQTALLEKAQKKLATEFGKNALTAQILGIIDNCYGRVMTQFQLIDPTHPDTLHQLRIAVKKFRYMLAASQELLPTLPEQHLQQLQAYLTRLGEIQNSCVLLDNLNRFFGHQPPPDIQTYFLQRHQALINDYMAHGSEIVQFWRASPKTTFPWVT